MHFYFGSNKERTRSTQTLVNSGLYWIEGSSKENSFTSLYCVSKEHNIPTFSVKCAIAQVRCFEKNEKLSLIYLEIYLVEDVMYRKKKVKF